jgi:sugar-specific transcriptional regulator TrmB
LTHHPKKASRPRAVVLADLPERNRLRELKAQLGERRDRIGELDLDIETLRDELAAFEASYRARVAGETAALKRIERLVLHLERWADLLREAPARPITAQAERLEAHRGRELAEQAAHEPPAGASQTPQEEGAAALPELPSDRLRAAYLALARRFHPDLARTEEERVRFGEWMSRINALYRDGDLQRLEAMAEQAKGGDVDEPEVDLPEQIAALEERLRWFDRVLESLRDEREALERGPTCELWRSAERAAAKGRDLVSEIQRELRERARKSYAHVASAARALESEVKRFNRRSIPDGALTRRQAEALPLRFDPFADKRIVRLGLEELRSLEVRPEVLRLAERLEAEVAAKPAVLRLLLFASVSELSTFPLPGLESYDDLALRFAALAQPGEGSLALERALVEADAYVEYGVRRASEKVVHLGLRFRTERAREAVPLMLKSLPIRREFKRVLGVLGERERCAACEEEVFAVPLFRTRGLGDLRALVCPLCGRAIRSYWMPRGKDVQAVLNTAFLDFGIVAECSFQLGRGSFGIQLLPAQLAEMQVGELRRRVYDDLFKRYELEVELMHLLFAQKGAAVPDEAPIAELESTTFLVRLAPESPLREGEALEVLRHRIRSRFRAQ